MRHWRILTAAIAVATVAACGGAGGSYSTSPSNPGNPPSNPGGTPPSDNTVTLGDQSFTPATLNITAGTTVTWKWTCSSNGYGGTSGCVTHTVTFDDGSGIASAPQDSGSFNRTFATAGTYKYHCAIHGPSMSGQVVVK